LPSESRCLATSAARAICQPPADYAHEFQEGDGTRVCRLDVVAVGMTIQETQSSAAVSAAEKASRVAAMSSPAALLSSASTARITVITSFAVAPPSRAILRR